MADFGENAAKVAVAAGGALTTGVSVPVIAIGGTAILIGYGIYTLLSKNKTLKKKDEALKAKDEEINALKKNIGDFNQALENYIKAYKELGADNSELKKDNAELISMCDRLIAELESDQILPSDSKGGMLSQLKGNRSKLLRFKAA